MEKNVCELGVRSVALSVMYKYHDLLSIFISQGSSFGFQNQTFENYFENDFENVDISNLMSCRKRWKF